MVCWWVPNARSFVINFKRVINITLLMSFISNFGGGFCLCCCFNTKIIIKISKLVVVSMSVPLSVWLQSIYIVSCCVLQQHAKAATQQLTTCNMFPLKFFFAFFPLLIFDMQNNKNNEMLVTIYRWYTTCTLLQLITLKI